MTFNEITKQAVQKALDNPREIDMNRVDAQQTRRVLDRLMGFRLSPLLWAVPFSTCVVLPAPLVRCAARSRVVALLAHELAHFRRGDHFCRWFEVFVLSLFWWNPVAWWARRQLHRAEEECCDAWVLWALPKQSREYAGAILETLDFLSGAQPVMPALASGLGAADVLERRLTMILHGSLPRRLSLRSQLGMLLVAAVVLPLSATAQDAPTTEASPDVVPVASNTVPAAGIGVTGTSAASNTPPSADAIIVTVFRPRSTFAQAECPAQQTERRSRYLQCLRILVFPQVDRMINRSKRAWTGWRRW